MTEPESLREAAIEGPVPRYELEAWRTRFGVVAGVTGRGDPAAPYNLGLMTPEPANQVVTRLRQLQSSFEGFGGFVQAHQVHGGRVRWHPAVEGWLIFDGMDGHATGAAGTLLMVTVADCIPVYLVDPKRRAVALLHAGWRGTAAGILETGIRLLEERSGSDRTELSVHLGVGICGPCYEVGREVFEGCGEPIPSTGKGPIDLRTVLARQATQLGVEGISVSPWCSAHDQDRFFSHRASGGRDGRMVAYLGFPARG
jgi:YfiH family protein